MKPHDHHFPHGPRQGWGKYHVRIVDRGGSPWTHAITESFADACAIARALPQYGKRNFHVWVDRPDCVDVDCPDGLTEEEREMAP